MKAAILIADGFEDLQLFHLWFRLREEGIPVTLAASSPQRVTGLRGYVAEPDMPIQEMNPAEYDLLIIPGGTAPEKLRQREEAVDVVRTFMQEERTVCAIGHGVQVLISAQALDGRAVACSAGIRDDVRSAGAVYREEGVVLDGNLLTARGTDDLPALANRLFRSLSLRTL